MPDDPTALASYGLDPNQLGADSLFPAYNPQYLTVVRITGGPNWQLDVNYAHFDLKGTTADAMLHKALNAITDHGKAPPQSFKAARAQLPELFVWRHPAGRVDVDSFADLGANCQTEMVFWLDINGATIDPAQMISLGQTLVGGGKAQPNDTYTAINGGQFANGPLIKVHNHFAQLDPATGKYVDRTAGSALVPYKMNVHFSLALASGQGTVPMVIDPNTGNGSGAEPP